MNQNSVVFEEGEEVCRLWDSKQFMRQGKKLLVFFCLCFRVIHQRSPRGDTRYRASCFSFLSIHQLALPAV